MQAVHDVHPKAYGLEHEAALVCRQCAAGRRNPEDEVLGQISGLRQCLDEVATDGDAVRLPVEHLAGIQASLFAVDDRADRVLLRVTNEPVGGLAVDGTEVGFAVHDCGRDAHLSTVGWCRGQRRSDPGRMSARGEV